MDWTVVARESRLLAELRQTYRQDAKERGLSWFQVARVGRVYPQLVQRILACTKCQRPTRGKNLALIEAIAEGMGYRLTLTKIPETTQGNPLL